MVMMMMMTLMMMLEHGVGGRPETAGGGELTAAAGQHGRHPGQPRGGGHQVRKTLYCVVKQTYSSTIWRMKDVFCVQVYRGELAPALQRAVGRHQ